MRLPTYATLTVLALLYVVAAGARFHTGRQASPYFSGASAMDYRGVQTVADGNSLTTPTNKANWPLGFRPASYRAAGAEYFVGHAYKVARYFSEVDGREFASRLLVLVFSLSVFTLYALTQRLWRCQAAGLLSAAIVAMFAPLVEVTNGREFGHVPFAVLLITLHALVLLRSHQRRSVAAGVIAAFVAFLVVAVWELGLYYVAAVLCVASFVPASASGERRWVIALHAVAVLAACATVPYLRVTRAAFSWPTALVVAVAASEFLRQRLGGRRRRGAAVVIATLLLTVLSAPLRMAATGGVPVLEYAWYRVRFLVAKPSTPGLLPPAIRALWSTQHAPPSAHALLDFFLPLSFFAAAAVLCAREHVARHRAAFLTAVALGLVGALAYVVDRSALALAAVAAVPVLSSSVVGISSAARSRGPVVALGAYLVAAQLVFPLGAANPMFQIARGGGFAFQDPSKFLWVSMQNTDKELVRFVAQRTSVSDPFLGAEDLTALLLTFAGRTSVPLAGAVTRAHLERNADLAHAIYEDETALYDTCQKLGVRYVVHSIDALLDTSRYSRRYLAGVPGISPESAVYRMHFHPESLRHFTLVYENEHHRLFEVGEEPRPVFLTDHPPAYQIDILERFGGDIGAFRQAVIDLLISYRDARAVVFQGDIEGALEKLEWCLRIAPRWTLARVAMGITLTRAGRLEEARDELLEVVAYAPDNTTALYHAAYVLAVLGETTRASDYLDVLFTTGAERALVEKARLLKTFLDQGIPVTPRSIPE